MGVTTSNLIMGPGTLYYAPFGTPEPADSDINQSNPGSGWIDVGGTLDGVSITLNQSYTELAVDQVVDVPGRRLTKREATLKTKLAEPTLRNLTLVMNAGIASSGAGYEVYEPPNDTSATQPTYSALLFDGIAPNGKRRRIFLRRVLSVEGISMTYSKDGQTAFEASFAAHYVSPSIRPFKVVDEL